MGDKLRSIGIEPVREEFAVSPRASIGGIPYAGYLGLIMSALVYVALHLSAVWYGMALASVVCWVWLILSVFFIRHGSICSLSRKYHRTLTVSFYRPTENTTTP